jgi:alpha-ribazole phosphatase
MYELARAQRDSKMIPLVYAVRHGETELNAQNKFRGHTNPNLDENGVKQAEIVRRLLKNINFGRVYSSDLKRAEQTGNIIAGNRKIPVRLLKNLRPWDIGEFTGRDKTEEAKKELQKYADHPNEKIPRGESLNQFRDRYRKAFDKIVRQAELRVAQHRGPTLVVQHASNGHEIGHILYNDIYRLDANPGGVIVVYKKNGKLGAYILHSGDEGKKSEAYAS